MPAAKYGLLNIGALFILNLFASPAFADFNFDPLSSTNCPKGSSLHEITPKERPSYYNTISRSCYRRRKIIRIVHWDIPSNQPYAIDDLASNRGPIYQAYRTYYKGLSAEKKKGLPSPENPHLSINWARWLEAGRGFKVFLDPAEDDGNLKFHSNKNVTIELIFDENGSEIQRNTI